jgi:hypothetical protein
MKSLAFRYLFPLLVLLAIRPAHAQYVASDTASKTTYQAAKPKTDDETNGNFFDKVNVGGNFGLSFGNITYLEASPLVSYRVSDKFQLGPGLTYIYYSYKGNGYNYTSNQFGGRFFARYFVLEDLFAHAELEALNFGFRSDTKTARYTQVYPLVGAGYRQSFGGHGGIFLTALYNLGYNPDLSTYNSPLIFRVGFLL